MLMKALLTGGILSVLAGSIVYFGTEGAVATEANDEMRVALETSELAGGKTTVAETRKTTETVTSKTVEADDPPKTRFLDQYLKSEKKKPAVKEIEDQPRSEPETGTAGKKSKPSSAKTYKADAESETDKTKKPGSRTREDIIGMMKGAAKRPITDESVLERARKDGPGSGFLPADGSVAKYDETRGRKVDTPQQGLPRKPADYDQVLDEARKLQITDMRDQALLEVIDYAIDQGDMGDAADIIPELSTPELRDTARSRIGTGLARRGKAAAAFAVLKEIEIDELTAPIRLEIISVLMETREEREEIYRKNPR